jgi:hypothetical protein
MPKHRTRPLNNTCAIRISSLYGPGMAVSNKAVGIFATLSCGSRQCLTLLAQAFLPGGDK